MNIVKRTKNEDRFVIDPPDPAVDAKKIVKILNEIKGSKDAFPQIKVSTRCNYEELQISNIRDFSSHSLELKYENSSWKVTDHQLPLAAPFKASTNLQDSIRTYLMLLENLVPFYCSLKELDDICIVGEPEVIMQKTCWRLVQYSAKVFIKIEFRNPLCIEEVSVTFHGCTNAVKTMTEIYNTTDYNYDDETIYNKLLNIFDVPYFPATKEDTVDCSICLSYRCDSNRLPIVCCDNERCDSTFHIACLEKYLKLQNHVKILSICIGECPFCKQTLSNSYAQFFERINSEGS